MKIKDNFFLGLLFGAIAFGITYLLLSLIPWGEKMPSAPYLLAFIPGLILMRILFVNLKYDKMGKGVFLVSLLGMLLVFFLVK